MAEQQTPQDVPWLSSEERKSWMALMALAQLLPPALDAQLKRDAGMNTFEYHILAALSESPTRTQRMSQLAVFAKGSLSRLSHAVARLEHAGWVVRRPSERDGRNTEAVLTEAGWQKIQEIAPGHVREARRLVLDVISPAQLAQLGAISRALVVAIAPDSAEVLDTGLPPQD